MGTRAPTISGRSSVVTDANYGLSPYTPLDCPVGLPRVPSHAVIDKTSMRMPPRERGQFGGPSHAHMPSSTGAMAGNRE
jgi:hypothetical protein